MKRLQDIGTTASISTSGSTPIVSQIEDVLAGIQSTLSQIITEYNAEVYPVVSSLPQGRDDTRWKMANNAIYPKRNYLDGNNIFVDSTASARADDGRYWRTDLLRPRTIKESFSQLYTEIQDQIDGLRTSISSYTNEGLTAAQKARIGMNIFDPILPSSASSLDGLTQTHELNFTQVGKDLYGASWSLDGDGLENLYYSVKEMVDALLQIHGGAWDTDVSVFHSSWGTPLSISEEGVSVEPGVANIDFVGAGITATQTSSGHVQVSVMATGLAIKDEGVLVDSSVTTMDFVGASVTATQTAPGSVEINVSANGGSAYLDWAVGYAYTTAVVPVEETTGQGYFNGSLVTGTLVAYFRATVNITFAGAVGPCYVKLYDMGAVGIPAAPVTIASLTTSTSGGPQVLEQALSVGAAPGANQIANTNRMYEVTVLGNAVNDIIYVGSAGLDVR